MVAWATFAYILDSRVVNIGAYEPNEYDKASYVAKATHGDDAFAVDVTYIPVHIGDEYDDGSFYRVIDGVRTWIEPYKTESNRIDNLETAGQETVDSLNNIELALVELYESGV